MAKYSVSPLQTVFPLQVLGPVKKTLSRWTLGNTALTVWLAPWTWSLSLNCLWNSDAVMIESSFSAVSVGVASLASSSSPQNHQAPLHAALLAYGSHFVLVSQELGGSYHVMALQWRQVALSWRGWRFRMLYRGEQRLSPSPWPEKVSTDYGPSCQGHRVPVKHSLQLSILYQRTVWSVWHLSGFHHSSQSAAASLHQHQHYYMLSRAKG